LRGKILIGFLIIIMATLSVGYYSYQSLSRLVTTMESESKPNPKNNQLKEIVLSLSDAESSVRAYTLTLNSNYLSPFYESASTIDDMLSTLNSMVTRDSLEKTWLDSLNYLIERKYFVMNDLINLKKDDSREKVLNRVLENIFELQKSKVQLQSINKNQKEKETQLPEIVPIEIQPSNGEPQNLQTKRPSIWQRIFGYRNRKRDSLVVVQKDVSDSTGQAEQNLIAQDSGPEEENQESAEDNKLEDYRSQLLEVVSQMREAEESSSQRAIEEELTLFEVDNSIMEDIRELVSKFERRERSISDQRTANAELLAAKTKARIAWIAGGSLGVFALLVIVIFRDVTVNNRNRKQLQNAKDYAEKLAKVKEEFLSNMSHEIRTPINSILGFAQQLEKTNMDTRQKAYLEVIKKSSDHLLALINDVLDYSKLESGRVSLEEIGFKPKLCVEEVYEALHPFAQSKNLKFTVEFEQIPEILIGDPVRLRQIIINLVNNAIKFTLKGKVAIKVTSVSFGKKCLLRAEVSDTGIGIKEENHLTIFETFNQADNSTSREFGGTGLGLSICKKLVESQNGKIGLVSTVGKGSTFFFEIPYILGSESDLPEVKQVSEIRNGIVKNEVVMVVDDEPYNILLFKTMLENHGIKPLTIENPLKVFDVLKSEKVDLILMDIQMPFLDGITLTRRLRRELNLTVPVIALTATASAKEKLKCIEAGFDGFITKPVEENTLINTIASFVGWDQIDNEKGERQSLDLNNLIEMGNNDLDFVFNMLTLFRTNFIQNLSQMKDAVAKGDLEKAGMKAHKMIPPCGHLGLTDIAKSLKVIENAKEKNVGIEEVRNRGIEIEKKGDEILKIIEIEMEKLKTPKTPLQNA